MNFIKTYSICISLFIAFSCENSTQNFNAERYPSILYDHFPYDLAHPDTSFILPRRLVEISGLTTLNDNTLLAVQDEFGIVFVINNSTGAIEREIKFGKKGDYEGVEYANGQVFILRSDGNMYEFEFPNEQTREVSSTVIKTSLEKNIDMEGLGYDKNTGSLLLASKEKGTKEGKSVFSYKIEGNELFDTPVCSITNKKIKKYVKDSKLSLPEKIGFKPSAVAIHPITNDMYILASVGKALLILDHEETILAFVQLNPYEFRQPEGICFASDGTMYISNEGSGSSARLLKFSYRKVNEENP